MRFHSLPTPPRHVLGSFALLILFPIGLILPVSAQTTEKPRESGWVSLFNGKDLEGWTPKIKGYELGDNFGNTFRVEDGVMKVSYDQYNKFDRKYGHIFYKDRFSNY